MLNIYNQDCVAGAKEHLADESVDLMICDPPSVSTSHHSTVSIIVKQNMLFLDTKKHQQRIVRGPPNGLKKPTV